MFSIILAAGKGTRMGESDLPKVCHEFDGVPVITRSIDLYTRCGIENHIVVIGDRAQEVAATICERFPRTMFAYQVELRGSGDATRCGAAILDAFGYEGDVFVVAGDKVLAERALREQLDLFRETGADACVMVGALGDNPTSGRIVEDDDGNILANIEHSDVARARLIQAWFEATKSGPLSAADVRAELIEVFRTEKKIKRAFPEFLELLDRHDSISPEQLAACFSPDEACFEFIGPDGKLHRFSGDEIERRCRYANLCVFVFRAEALRYALAHISSNNAQREEYLTDTVGVLAAARTADGRPRFRVVPYCVAEKTDALAFNSLEELNAIREHYGD